MLCSNPITKPLKSEHSKNAVVAATDLYNVLVAVFADDRLHCDDVKAAKQLAAFVDPRTKSTHDIIIPRLRFQMKHTQGT